MRGGEMRLVPNGLRWREGKRERERENEVP